MGEDQKRLSKKPGRGFWFLQTHAFSAFLGWRKDGNNAVSGRLFTYFISVHSTAHGKPLVVDSSSYV